MLPAMIYIHVMTFTMKYINRMKDEVGTPHWCPQPN